LPVVGSALFYFVSNFGVWASGSMYPPTWAGLAQCYAAALPFLRNTLTSDLIYFNSFSLLAALFGRLALPKLAAKGA
ncbi:MAG TPA: DUF6580 family putative transport protein, partial [candidate division Zixibacteria bacterium]|nr:DUF6580 family putative transport protein [candidate division Zixibacteria bacterium]